MTTMFPRSILKDICMVLSSVQYAALASSDPILRKKKKLEVDKKYVFEKSFCRVSRTISNECFCVVGKQEENEHLLYYLNLVLDSSFGRIFIGQDDGNFLPNGSVHLKSLRELSVPIPGEDIVKAGADLKKGILIILSVVDEKNSEFNEHYAEAIRGILNEISDCFVMELYSRPFFDSSDIHIIDSWLEILNNSTFSRNSSGALDLLQALTSSDSALMTNVRRFRALISDLSSIINSSK